jgi:carbamoyltransferase
MQKKLNLQIKFRESFRPFAPIVLAEKALEWFEGFPNPSPYMLFVAQVLEKHLLVEKFIPKDSIERLNTIRSTIPAVTHLDNSARLQTVSSQQNHRLHQLLLNFEKMTGVPILVNTSFNVRGEPIVESPKDAILCFLKTDLDLLVIGDFLVEKQKNLDKVIKNKLQSHLD